MFLHGVLEEEVYMTQQLSYESREHLDFICKLDKAIHGLKQAPRAWHAMLRSKLVDLRFISSKGDTSFFFYQDQCVTMFVLIDVDDIILGSSSPKATNAFLRNLEKEFS
jgi:hypothetical protein